MRTIHVWLFAVVTMTNVVLAFADESKKGAQLSSEEIVRAGIIQFDERMQSDDTKVRDSEFDAVMPDKKMLERLFGDDANLVWPRLSEGLK